jgi:anti-anti-sigma factor
MAHFEATTSVEPGRVVVALTGECDLAGRDELAAVLLAAVDSAPAVFVDMAGLTFIDSSGLHAVISAHHAARRAGGRLFVVNAGGRVATLLDLTGVAHLLSPPADDGDRSA